MRSNITKEILSETSPETKDKVREYGEEMFARADVRALMELARRPLETVIDQLQREADHREFNLQELQKENDRLHSEIREFKLTCRAYFSARTVARFSSNGKQAAEAVLKEAEFEKKILSELEAFTLQEQNELPFKD